VNYEAAMAVYVISTHLLVKFLIDNGNYKLEGEPWMHSIFFFPWLDIYG
jgi:hypothetical protein